METLSLITITLSLLALLSPTPTKATLIEDVCSHATDPNSCTKLLQSDPRASSVYNLYDLGMVIVKMEVEAVQDTQNAIAGMKRNRGYPLPVLDALDFCDNRCQDVLYACDKAAYDVEAHEFRHAKFDCYDMGDAVQLCRSKMIDYRIEAFSEKNDKAFFISYVGSLVMSMLEKLPPFVNA